MSVRCVHLEEPGGILIKTQCNQSDSTSQIPQPASQRRITLLTTVWQLSAAQLGLGRQQAVSISTQLPSYEMFMLS